MINHGVILPILIPAFFSILLVGVVRKNLFLTRIFSLTSSFLTLLVSLSLLFLSTQNEIIPYFLGNWPAPFGIVLVLDRLSALMISLTALLAFLVLIYTVQGWDRRGLHFHALFQLQIMGLNGAFLTGDLFNLFVFFEVLLIASYGLMVHSAGANRLRAGLQYVIINLVGSSLFLVAVGLIYSVTGTLNMADLSLKVAEIGASEQALLKTGALLLLYVFTIKAALVPVQFWLPATYSLAPAPVAALFAIMTKVGVYAIIRVYTLIFYSRSDEFTFFAADWLLPIALITLLLGALGTLAARRLSQLVSFSIIASLGTMMIAVSLFSLKGLSSALYYLIHSTFAAAALFLIVDLINQRRTKEADIIKLGPNFSEQGALSLFFFITAIAMTGLPPLAGFLAKLLILDASRDVSYNIWIWSFLLLGSLITIIGFSLAGSLLFWKRKTATTNEQTKPTSSSIFSVEFLCLSSFVILLVLTSVFAGPLMSFTEASAQQLLNSNEYIEAVLTPREGMK